MNLSQIKYFTEVAKCQSLAQAAKELYISPSTLSVAINKLENSLGTRLFYRDNTGMYLTEAGRLIYEDCRTILGLIDSWPEKLHPQNADISGSVFIQSRPIVTESLLIDLIKDAKKMYPRLELVITEDIFSVETFLKNSGRIAFAIFEENAPIFPKIKLKLDATSYRTELLYKTSLQVFLNRTSPLAEKDILSIEDLKNYSFLRLYASKADHYFNQVAALFPASQVITLPNRSAIIRYLEDNPDAFSLLFSSMDLDEKYIYEDDTVAARPLTGNMKNNNVYLIYPDRNTITPQEAVIVELIKDMI